MSSFTFNKTTGGFWNVNGNWTPNGLPGSNDQVNFIAGTYTSTVDGGPWTLQSLDVNQTGVTLDIGVNVTAQVENTNIGTIDVLSGATFTLGSENSNAGQIIVRNKAVFTVQNLNGNVGNITAASGGLVLLQGNGTGNFTVAGGTLEVAGNFNGSGVITMNAGSMWLAGNLGNSSYNVGNGLTDQVYFDGLQPTTTNAFTGVDLGDRLAIKGVTITSHSYVGTTLTLGTTGGTKVFTNVTLAPGLEQHAITGTETFKGNSYGYIQLACFAAGTRIDTPSGAVAVEELAKGQLVLTAAGETRPIRWIGHRRLDLRRHPDPALAQPIRIERDAFAASMPHHDLLVSPDHAIFVDGMLICARQLMNGTTIRQERDRTVVDYYHVELDQHAILLAEGLPAESYIDTGNRGFFANSGAPLALHPDLTDETGYPTREAHSCAPFVSDEARVRPVWQRLANRAAVIGRAMPQRATTTDARLHLQCPDGRTVKPLFSDSNHVVFALPAVGPEVRLVSRAQAPTEARPWLDDQRQLGVRVKRLVLRGIDETREVAMDHPDLTRGWWAVERDGLIMNRWTDGAAALPLPTMRGHILLEVHLAGSMTYLADPVPADGTERRAAA
jgi:hypothetical protein